MQDTREPTRETEVSRRGEPEMPWTSAPFTMMRQLANEIDRMFENMGLAQPWPGRILQPARSRTGAWSPEVEMFERDGHLVVRADLPGMKKDEIEIEVRENALILQGERKQEHREEREGFYHTERSYGRFFRRIPLPENVEAEKAKASFENGVLEITLPAPALKQPRGRRIKVE